MAKHARTRTRSLAKVAVVGAGASLFLVTPAHAAQAAEPQAAEASIMDGIWEPDTDESNMKKFDEQRKQYEEKAKQEKAERDLPSRPAVDTKSEKPEIVTPGPAIGDLLPPPVTEKPKPEIVTPGPAIGDLLPPPVTEKPKPEIVPPGPGIDDLLPPPVTDKPKPEIVPPGPAIGEKPEKPQILPPAPDDKDCNEVKPVTPVTQDKAKDKAKDKGTVTGNVVTPKGGVAAGVELANTGTETALYGAGAAGLALLGGAGLALNARRRRLQG
ncbi:LPXTG cell wall anchor domain-containing protein (plasmid) [Streptomyces sp. BI20]|uniref:LPXTG cell wall anchor domain-containing protein n=1 Tax=Streptomyces sp. BI20 TaxID=3403460 RepID=UPI003C7232B3